MVNLKQVKHVFLVGIKGVAMAHIASILVKMGKKVSGYDVADDFITSEGLSSPQVTIYTDLDLHNLASDVDLVIYSAAHGGSSNPFAQEAHKKDITVLHQALFLGELMKQFEKTVGVSGCHGKTTTTSLLSHALIELGEEPSYLVGTSEFSSHPGGDYRSNKYFVIEADEYGVDPPRDTSPKFSFLHPHHIICTNIDFDHPDVYKNLDAVKEAYASFFQDCVDSSLRNDPCLFVCNDDLHTKSVIHQFPKDKVVTFGFDSGSDAVISGFESSEKESRFNLSFKGKMYADISICLWGEKQITNAAGVFVYLLAQGFDGEKVKKVFSTFTGLKRRFEHLGSVKDVDVYDDYAHHPEEIKALLQSAKERFPTRAIKIIFQPHTFSRTKMLLEQFALSFKEANEAVLLPIFSSAREIKPEQDDSITQIVTKAKEHNIHIAEAPSNHEAVEAILQHIQPQDVIFTVGAGDVYKLGDDIIRGIDKRL